MSQGRVAEINTFYTPGGKPIEEIAQPSKALAIPAPTELATTGEVFAEYLSEESRAITLETDDDLQLATHIINDIKQRLDALEAIRQAVSLPISQGLERYNSLFRPRKKQGQEAREVWDAKIRAFVNAREVARRTAEAALQMAIETQDAPAATVAIASFQPAPKAAGLILQEGWDFEERNHDIVPASLTVTDRTKVAAEIKRQLGEGVAEPAVPGLRIFKKQIVKATG